MLLVEIIGTLAGSCTTMCFIPQAYKVIKAPNTKAISLLMYAVFSLGVTLWLFYGIMLDSFPVILSNALTLPLTLIILGKKILNTVKGIDND
jgi:MtN3 and saliva related transmembrane protein